MFHRKTKTSLQCEAPKIAKLVSITPITMVYGTYNYSYWGESKPTNITGGPHIVSINRSLTIQQIAVRSSPLTKIEVPDMWIGPPLWISPMWPQQVGFLLRLEIHGNTKGLWKISVL